MSTSSIAKNAAAASRWLGRKYSELEWASVALSAYGRSVPVTSATVKNTKIRVGSTSVATDCVRLEPSAAYTDPESTPASAVTNPASPNRSAPPRMSPAVPSGSGKFVRTGISSAIEQYDANAISGAISKNGDAVSGRTDSLRKNFPMS